MDAVKQVCDRVGGVTALARKLGVRPPTVHQWCTDARPVPARMVPTLVDMGGPDVRHWQFRPDDWHRLWPELIGAEGAPPVPVAEPTAQEAA